MPTQKRIQVMNRDDLAPPVDAREALAKNKVLSAMDKITQEDIDGMMAATVTKAKNGDMKAVSFVFGIMGGNQPRHGTTNIQQVAVQNDPYLAANGLSDRRLALVHYLANMGPMDLETLAEKTNTPSSKVRDAILDHPWFDRTHHGWDITPIARLEVLMEAAEAEPAPRRPRRIEAAERPRA
jgi:hypothetical protein